MLRCRIALGTCAAIAIAVCAPALAQGLSLTRGPILQQTDTDSAVIVVELDSKAAIQVRYGTEAQLDRKVSSAAAVRHEIELTGLSPDTRYDYVIWARGETLSPRRSLWTAVEPGSPFRFVLYGDTRSNPVTHMEVVDAIAAEAPNLLVHTGDLVDDGWVAWQWDEFFAIEAPLLSQVPLYPVLGNHEEHNEGDALLFREAFALPNNELYYSFEYGNAHFLMLDGHVHVEPWCEVDGYFAADCLTPKQLAWIRADLAAAAGNPEIDHIFVVTHVGPYTSTSGRDGSASMRSLLPLLRAYGVTAVLSGHDHYYERGDSAGGLPYVISGGAAASLYETGSPNSAPHTIHINDESHHYVVFDLAGTTAQLTAKALDGRVIDQVTLTAGDRDCREIVCASRALLEAAEALDLGTPPGGGPPPITGE